MRNGATTCDGARPRGQTPQTGDLAVGVRLDDAGYELPVTSDTGARDFDRRASRSLPLTQLGQLLALGGSLSPLNSAKTLLDEFGSFGAVVAGSGKRLRRLLVDDGEAIAILAWFRQAMLAALDPSAGERAAISDWTALTRYLQAGIGFACDEKLRALFLDARNHLLADDVISSGTATALAFDCRCIIARALEIGAAGLILVHNHPSGDTTPSQADVQATERMQELCNALDITLHDHLIVGGGHSTSLRQLGLLKA